MHSRGREHFISFLHPSTGMLVWQISSILYLGFQKAVLQIIFVICITWKQADAIQGVGVPHMWQSTNSSWPIFCQTTDNQQLHTAQGTWGRGEQIKQINRPGTEVQPHCSCYQVLYYLYSFSCFTNKNRLKGENELAGIEHTDTSFPALQEINDDSKREWAGWGEWSGTQDPSSRSTESKS